MYAEKGRVLIAGGGLAGLTAAKYLIDEGYRVRILEKRQVLGGKASSWEEPGCDWTESGLHVFFGAYRNLLGFLRETGIEEHLVWMPHTLTFSKPGGVISPLQFPAQLPAPFHGLTAIARNRGVLRTSDKLRTGAGLLWPILANQRYIDSQDGLTYADWHLGHGMSKQSLADFFDTMALALNFGKSDEVSAKLLLTVLSHFGKETEASRVAFLKGSPEKRLFWPLREWLERRGAEFVLGAKVSQVLYDPVTNEVNGLLMADGSTETADHYVSAVPVHNLWRILPPTLRERAPFAGLRHLHGVPVMTVQLFFDQSVTGVRNLFFASGTHISVYAELGRICPDFDRGVDGRRSMVELVVAPAAEWFRLDDKALVEKVMAEFSELHPAARQATLEKYTIVRIPQSVYKARPGMDKYRPDQATSVPNLFLCGDYTRQEYLASMEGAVLSGKKAARAIVASATALRDLEVAVGI